MRQGIISYLTQFYLLKMVKKFLLVTLLLDYPKKQPKLKISPEDYLELQNYLRQENLLFLRL